MTPEDLIDTLDADARDAKELAEVARRIVAERDEARSQLRLKGDYSTRFKLALGARPEEIAVSAAARVVAERDKALAERDKARAECDKALVERDKALVERDKARAERDKAWRERDEARADCGPARQAVVNTYVEAIRMAHASLGSKWGERLPVAAARVVRERDEARAERDAAKAELRAARPEPRKPKVGDRIRILEYYNENGFRKRSFQRPAVIVSINYGNILLCELDNGREATLDSGDRWEFVA